MSTGFDHYSPDLFNLLGQGVKGVCSRITLQSVWKSAMLGNAVHIDVRTSEFIECCSAPYAQCRLGVLKLKSRFRQYNW